MAARDRDGWVPSPGPWVPPQGCRPGWDWSPGRYGMRPRTEAMPLWLKAWYRTPFLDRSAHEYMWHHGYWAVPPSLTWNHEEALPQAGRTLERSRFTRFGRLRLAMMRRRRFHFGIRWSPIFHVIVLVVAVVARAVGLGWTAAVLIAVFGEAALAAISLWHGRNLGRDARTR
jgi:hypothetical protein